MHNKKCSNNCQGCQCHKGKDPKVKRHEHEDFEKKSEMNNSWISAIDVYKRQPYKGIYI